MRHVAVALVVFSLAISAIAAELGRANGSLTIDKTRTDLGYAYAIGKQHNDISKRKDETRVILTDKALAPEINLNEIEATVPDGVNAVIFNLASNGKVTHVSVIHPKGSYDGGFLEEAVEFRFKNANAGRGTIAGRISSSRVQTNTMTFQVDADFNALVR